METLKFFKPDGSLRGDQPDFGDPYRDRDDAKTFGSIHTDDDGYFDADVFDEASEVADLPTCRATSIAAQIFHAGVFGGNTKEHYPPIYYWR